MQAPPPVPNLLIQLKTMASNVNTILGYEQIDWLWRSQDTEWSLTEVMCHLRDVEAEIHQTRFTAVLNENDVFLAGVSADDWAVSRKYRDQDGVEAIADFLTARERTITLLEKLSPEMWDRFGVHAFFGRTTLHELLFLVSRHDELHWEQITSLIVGQMTEEPAD